jgi:hypothetical protein
MTNDIFEGFRAKISRAKFHFEEFNSEIKTGLDSELYGLDISDDPNTGERVVRAKLPQELFLRYSIIVGEIVHQLHSALDHLVWQLTIQNGHEPIKGVTGFPIFCDEVDYNKRGQRMLKDINLKAVKIIHDLQPFEADYSTNSLYILKELWNRDKHRAINFASITLVAYATNYIYPSGRVHQIPRDFPTTFDNDAEIRFFHPSDFTSQVKINEVFAWKDFVFKEAGPATGLEVKPLLLQLINFVDDVGIQLIRTATQL